MMTMSKRKATRTVLLSEADRLEHVHPQRLREALRATVTAGAAIQDPSERIEAAEREEIDEVPQRAEE